MGVYFQSLPGTVALQTGLAIGMAGLTGLKIPQRLPAVL
jgi:hypothetical protein